MFCPKCGKELLEGSKFCKYCGNEIYKVENKTDSHDGVYTVSTSGKRLLNYILDYIGFYIFVFIVGLLLGLVFPSLIDAGDNLYTALALLLVVAYYIFFESIWQRTPGKFITKTTVVNKDGTKPNFLTILGRTLCRFIPFDALSFLVGNNPVGWHDSISNTIVVPTHYSNEDIQKIDLNKKNRKTNILIIIIVVFVVVAIIGFLSTLAVVSLNSARSKARDARRISDMQQVSTALEMYYLNNNTYVGAYTIGSIKADTNIEILNLNEIHDPSGVVDAPSCSTKITNQENVCNYSITMLSENDYEVCFYMENDGDYYSRGINNIKPQGKITPGCSF